MKNFKFTCKQNQVAIVVSLLGSFGKPHVKIENGFPVVTLKHNSSNRKINKFLFDNNVPGATRKKNLKIVKCERWDIPYLSIKPKEWFVWATGKKLIKAYYKYEQHCECCGPILEVFTKKNGKIERL